MAKEVSRFKKLPPEKKKTGPKPKHYWSKMSDHTMIRKAPHYNQTGALTVPGEIIQFRNNHYETLSRNEQDYIEKSDDWMVIVFPTAEEAGILSPPKERVLSMMGTDFGTMEPSEAGGSRTYKKENAEYEEPDPNAPAELPE